MFEKAGKFYADWRDRAGIRHRKSFASARAAIRFEAEMKEQAHPKNKTLGRPLPHYSASNKSGGVSKSIQTPSPQHNSSSRLLVLKKRKS